MPCSKYGIGTYLRQIDTEIKRLDDSSDDLFFTQSPITCDRMRRAMAEDFPQAQACAHAHIHTPRLASLTILVKILEPAATILPNLRDGFGLR